MRTGRGSHGGVGGGSRSSPQRISMSRGYRKRPRGVVREADIVSPHRAAAAQRRAGECRASVQHEALGALLINTSRGRVDEAARLMPRRPPAGRRCWMSITEPPWRDHPFVIEFDNVIITPHIAEPPGISQPRR
ncbi:hypothetical protein MJ579_08485 [Klebsiella pneumoniae]|nr:hypothetical protein MJ579_08485 [Klebsiella pneumoniae]